MKETVTVYWAPAITPETSTSNLLYSTPVPVLNRLRKSQVKSLPGTLFSCPATTSLFNNVFELSLPISLETSLTEEDKLNVFVPPFGKDILNGIAPISLMKNRRSNLEGYFACAIGGFGWIFFAEEPLVARFSAPYFPPSAPTEGAILAAGEFDIGNWYRPMNFEYHIPQSAESITFKEQEPIGYVEFKTEKEIVFKRYQMTPFLFSLVEEVMSTTKYSKFWGKKSYLPLSKRYQLFKKAHFNSLVLSEIKKNVIE